MKASFRIALTIFVLLLSKYTKCLESGLYVQLKSQGCIACNISAALILSELESLSPSFVFLEKRYEEDLKLIADFKLQKVIFSDSLYRMLNPSFHSAVVVCNSRIAGIQNLKNQEDVKKLKSLVKYPCINWKQPKRIKVSANLSKGSRSKPRTVLFL